MKAVIQRVRKAKVEVEDRVVGEISKGILILLGIAADDNEEKLIWVAQKCVTLRIFNDEQNKLNLSLEEVNGEILVVSQFTLYGDPRKGRRPSYVMAAQPEKAQDYYMKFVNKLRSMGFKVETGIFGASMIVTLENDGPVTLIAEK